MWKAVTQIRTNATLGGYDRDLEKDAMTTVKEESEFNESVYQFNPDKSFFGRSSRSRSAIKEKALLVKQQCHRQSSYKKLQSIPEMGLKFEDQRRMS
jgi:hypothetical protein